jgi:hypothetical protein
MRAGVGLLVMIYGLAAGQAWAEPSAATPSPVTGKDFPTIDAWAIRNLDLDGWVFVGFTTPDKPKPSVVVWYVAEQPRPGSKYPLMLEYVRTESALTPGSGLFHSEVDCATHQARDVEEVFYQANNLHGRIVSVRDLADKPMERPLKGSMGEVLINLVCRDAR